MRFHRLGEGAIPRHIFIINDLAQCDAIPGLTADERNYIAVATAADHHIATINRYTSFVIVLRIVDKKTTIATDEAIRKHGAEVQAIANKHKWSGIAITNLSANVSASVLLAEGAALASYQFLKYKSDADKLKHSLTDIYLADNSIGDGEIVALNIITDAIYRVRSLVNEPLNFLSAEQLSAEIEGMGRESGFNVTVYHKSEIEMEKMGGLLAVNRGSIDPPTFTVMEHKPANALNSKPIVLIGKGIVFDTGGVSLKSTLNSMDRMKSDMSGAALVSGAMFAIASLALPLHVIALVPATDNRPGENAYVPGDIITMYSGKKVEVLNTDAEGRMVLADALHWAKRYEPELVFDFATLTGAASAAIGEHGIVCMGNANDEVKGKLRESGQRQYERLVEFPMWDEYGDQIKSDVADIKNVGGSTGGAITAGKFLEHFTSYPWMHFDIAGVSFATAKHGYFPTGGTAFGLRMLLDFLANYGK